LGSGEHRDKDASRAGGGYVVRDKKVTVRISLKREMRRRLFDDERHSFSDRGMKRRFD